MVIAVDPNLCAIQFQGFDLIEARPNLAPQAEQQARFFQSFVGKTGKTLAQRVEHGLRMRTELPGKTLTVRRSQRL
jgi:hypothetical protein